MGCAVFGSGAKFPFTLHYREPFAEREANKKLLMYVKCCPYRCCFNAPLCEIWLDSKFTCTKEKSKDETRLKYSKPKGNVIDDHEQNLKR